MFECCWFLQIFYHTENEEVSKKLVLIFDWHIVSGFLIWGFFALVNGGSTEQCHWHELDKLDLLLFGLCNSSRQFFKFLETQKFFDSSLREEKEKNERKWVNLCILCRKVCILHTIFYTFVSTLFDTEYYCINLDKRKWKVMKLLCKLCLILLCSISFHLFWNVSLEF